MKAMKLYIGSILAGVTLLASCTAVDYPDRFQLTPGVPSVDYVRYADRDLIIDQAAMAETVCIVGENLTSVHDLYFNDQQAILNTSYMTAHTLIVAVPKTLPTVEDNKIHLITRDSTVVLYDFKVLPPAPKISGMSNEWAAEGETVTVNGSYLFAPLTVQFPGVDPIDITEAGGDSFEVKVPAGCCSTSTALPVLTTMVGTDTPARTTTDSASAVVISSLETAVQCWTANGKKQTSPSYIGPAHGTTLKTIGTLPVLPT